MNPERMRKLGGPKPYERGMLRRPEFFLEEMRNGLLDDGHPDDWGDHDEDMVEACDHLELALEPLTRLRVEILDRPKIGCLFCLYTEPDLNEVDREAVRERLIDEGHQAGCVLMVALGRARR